MLVDRTDPWSSIGRRYLYPGKLCRAERRVFGAGLCHLDRCTRPAEERLGCIGSHALMGTEAIAVVAALAYLSSSQDHPVEAKRSEPRYPTKAEKRDWRDKPWRREDLSSVILLDLARAGEYGHPSHASPRPHTRRGHWRRLPVPEGGNARRSWVRPTWVGATTWTHEGQTYRVVTSTTPPAGAVQ